MRAAEGHAKHRRMWCRVGCEKRALSILLSESTMRAAIGHAKQRRMWCRVGCEKRVLSILLSESTMRAAIGHAKHRRMWCRVGCEKRALSILKTSISLSALNNYFSKLGESDEPIYKNKKCTIRKGTLYVKPTTRGRKKQGE